MLTPEELLKDIFIHPDFDRSQVSVTVTPPAGCTKMVWRIMAEGTKVGAGSLAHPKETTRIECPVINFRPWTIESPFLYTLTVDFTTSAGAFEVSQKFGMRKFHVENNRICLNNRPFYVRGVIRGRQAHDHPDLCGLSEEAYYEKYIRAAKRFGFNFIRFHSKVPPRAYFDAADRLGILTHVEVRKYYGKYQAERELLDHDPVLVKPRDWEDAIRSIRNHASLMVYCLGNEINSPGTNPEVAERAAQLRKLDPTRLFIDTCARGQYDRENIDLDVQHMGYFAPFGRNYHMFDTTANWAIFGSVKDGEMLTGEPGALTRREVPVNFPVVAHEVGHAVVLRDLETLDGKFAEYGAPRPWWIDELKKLRKQKGLEQDYPKMRRASQRFQHIWHKQILESVRRSRILSGFHFLQLADTERYENANGLIDCFDEPKGVRAEDYLPFNGDAVVLADLPRRTFFEEEALTVPVLLSNFSEDFAGEAQLRWRLTSDSLDITGQMDNIEARDGLARIATLEILLPKSRAAQALTLAVTLEAEDGRAIENAWPLWLYPNRPEKLPLRKATVLLKDLDLHRRYGQLRIATNLRRPEKLVITDRFAAGVFTHLERGGDVLMLYRIDETRDRSAERERYYMPSTWDRFKPVLWDRGHNLGGFVRPHRAIRHFPNDGLIDFQFARLIDDCDKLSLDDFPVEASPIVQGVDKAVRDRYDVFTFKLRELQPAWTMRKFAYLFDLRVGKGRLMMSGFNLTGLEREVPEAVGMFESLIACVTAKSWRPRARITSKELKKYLADKGRAPRIKERMMTQYWQFDAEPLESDRYWKEAEAWIRKG